jgi:hypothetical protein
MHDRPQSKDDVNETAICGWASPPAILLILVVVAGTGEPRTVGAPFTTFVVTATARPMLFDSRLPLDCPISDQVKVLVTAIAKEARAEFHIRQPCVELRQLSRLRPLIAQLIQPQRITTGHLVDDLVQVPSVMWWGFCAA